MNLVFTLAASSLLSLAVGGGLTVAAQVAPSVALGPRPPRQAQTGDTTVVAPAAPTFVVIYGRVESLEGPLPGAVVKLNDKQAAVTNAQGEFSLKVPATGEPLPITVSYAGYADVAATLLPLSTTNTVRLTAPRVIKVARKSQLKAYMKTSRRQVKRTLRRL